MLIAGEPPGPECGTGRLTRLFGAIRQGSPDRDLHGRIVAALTIKAIGLGQAERRLRHETRRRAAMPLRRMNKEWVAQIDRARLSHRQCFRPIGTDVVEVHVNLARLAGRFEEPRHVHMRSDPDPRRRIIQPDIGKEK